MCTHKTNPRRAAREHIERSGYAGTLRDAKESPIDWRAVGRVQSSGQLDGAFQFVSKLSFGSLPGWRHADVAAFEAVDL